VLAAQATRRAAPAPASPSHEADLAALDSYLASGDTASAAALLRRLAPALDADERFALDATYCLLRRRQFPEARELWGRVAPRIQASVRAARDRQLSAVEEQARLRVAEGLFVQGLLAADLGTKEEALRLLRQADGYGFPPLDSPLMGLAADTLFELQEHALAAQAYREVLKRAPDGLQARLRLGACLYSTGQLDAAQAELEQVLRRDPRLAQANYYLGAVLFEQKRGAEARASLERALALDPRCSGCMAKLAHLAYLDGDDARCEAWLAKAAALDPGYLETNLVYGLLYNRSGRYELAIRHLTRVVEQGPGYAKAQYQLALAYQRSGNTQKAREHLEIYDKLIEAQKARGLGVRGSEP
jgi:tetratricopeptide (TPR) repeat protein